MEEMILFDSELKVMEIIWREKEITAKEISLLALKDYNWNKNTTYTIIKKLLNKGAISREEPNFKCKPLVSKVHIQRKEARKFVEKLYDGSSKLLLSSFIEDEKLSKEDLISLRALIDEKL